MEAVGMRYLAKVKEEKNKRKHEFRKMRKDSFLYNGKRKDTYGNLTELLRKTSRD